MQTTTAAVARTTITLVARAANPNPTTPAFSDDLEWITAYLAIHMLSVPSRRYSFLLWIAVVLVFLVFALLHWTGSKGGVVGAYWSKWSVRRRTWGKWETVTRRGQKIRKQPILLPSNAQLLCLGVLFTAAFLLSFLGPDYINPRTHVWDIAARSLEARKLKWDPTAFVGYAPQYTISKAWWTIGGRTGMIAFALLPLCVLFALKAPPFALFALPFMIQIHFDKLAWLHRWSGRLIYFLTVVHVATWCVQLWHDRKTSAFVDNKHPNKRAFMYAWQFERFIFAWIAFGLFTILILLSIMPLRRSHYETFWFLHVLLVPMTIAMAAFHHPPIWYWCWAALGLWAGERLWRAGAWLWKNGVLGSAPPFKPGLIPQSRQKHELKNLLEISPFPLPSPAPAVHQHRPLSPYDPHHDQISPISPGAFTPGHRPYDSDSSVDASLTTPTDYTPPFGYAHAELLAGMTVRLTFIPPRPVSWAPGQHFLICIPAISYFLSHPFTAASVSDMRSACASGRKIVFLVRAKAGWTRDLWDEVMSLVVKGFKHHPSEKQPPEDQLPPRGLLMRMYVDGPFGSSIRSRWGGYSTAVIATGGSGVSFGLSVLEYLCLCMAGRDGRDLGGRPGGWGKRGFMTRRIRFVWLVREFSHIQWCASILRRCVDLIPRPGLQVDIFVTNLSLPPRISHRDQDNLRSPSTADFLAPPTPYFARESRRRDSISSVDSGVSEAESDSSEIDLSYYTGDPRDTRVSLNRDDMLATGSIIDLTNFDGEDDTRLPGEDRLSHKVRKTGKHKRTMSRRRRPEKIDVERAGFGAASTDKLLDGAGMSRISEERPLSPHGVNAPRSPVLMSPSEDTLTGSHEYPPTRARTRPMSLTFSEESHVGAPRAESAMSNNWDARSNAHSLHGLMGDPAPVEEFRLQVDRQEMKDVSVVSEFARPGRPILERILADEVEKSRGAVVVACCGPTSLNAVLRKAIAAQINPDRIRHGDMRGSISLVSEEFEY